VDQSGQVFEIPFRYPLSTDEIVQVTVPNIYPDGTRVQAAPKKCANPSSDWKFPKPGEILHLKKADVPTEKPKINGASTNLCGLEVPLLTIPEIMEGGLEARLQEFDPGKPLQGVFFVDNTGKTNYLVTSLRDVDVRTSGALLLHLNNGLGIFGETIAKVGDLCLGVGGLRTSSMNDSDRDYHDSPRYIHLNISPGIETSPSRLMNFRFSQQNPFPDKVDLGYSGSNYFLLLPVEGLHEAIQPGARLNELYANIAKGLGRLLPTSDFTVKVPEKPAVKRVVDLGNYRSMIAQLPEGLSTVALVGSTPFSYYLGMFVQPGKELSINEMIRPAIQGTVIWPRSRKGEGWVFFEAELRGPGISSLPEQVIGNVAYLKADALLSELGHFENGFVDDIGAIVAKKYFSKGEAASKPKLLTVRSELTGGYPTLNAAELKEQLAEVCKMAAGERVRAVVVLNEMQAGMAGFYSYAIFGADNNRTTRAATDFGLVVASLNPRRSILGGSRVEEGFYERPITISPPCIHMGVLYLTASINPQPLVYLFPPSFIRDVEEGLQPLFHPEASAARILTPDNYEASLREVRNPVEEVVCIYEQTHPMVAVFAREGIGIDEFIEQIAQFPDIQDVADCDWPLRTAESYLLRRGPLTGSEGLRGTLLPSSGLFVPGHSTNNTHLYKALVALEKAFL
jgi:hypothetical protein